MIRVSPDSRKLAVVMVGLPARGKSYTARRIERYLGWLGYRTRVFNVGEYRRREVGAKMPHDFFNPRNREGGEARKQLALHALADMSQWLDKEGDVAIYDATNTTVSRRAMVRQQCEKAGFEVLFIELVCTDPSILEANIRSTKLRSPDYANVEPERAVADFRQRIAHYEQVYEPVHETEGAYLQVTDAGRAAVVRNLDGYLASRLVFFLMNLHLSERPILLTRHGESEYNQRGLLGGDPQLSELGQQYAEALGHHLSQRYPDPDGLAVWTSSLARAVQTTAPLGRASRAWRALDEIDAGVCDGMSYSQIKEHMPDEFAARKADKLNYRYPRGESYQDVIVRLDPVIIELERTRKPVLVVAHNAVIRALTAYFLGTPRARCPHLDIPLHVLSEMRPHAYGCQEIRTPLLTPLSRESQEIAAISDDTGL